MLFLSPAKLVLAFALVSGYVSSQGTSSSSQAAAEPAVHCATGQATVPPLQETDCQRALDQVPAVQSKGDNFLSVDDKMITQKYGSCEVKLETNNGGKIYVHKSKATLGLQYFINECAQGAGSILVPHGSTVGQGNTTVSIFFNKPSGN